MSATWWSVALAEEVTGDKPLSVDIGDQPLVLWRDAGGVARALEDRCPHRRCLDVWLRHWWGEVQYDIEACVSTITPDVVYRWDGTERLGEPLHAQSRDFARTMYSGMFESHQTPGGPFDQERWAFGEWGLMMEAVFTSVMRADFIREERSSAGPAELRLVQWPMTLVIPVDRESGLMSGEIMYAGAPLHVEPCDVETTLRLLGRLS